MQVVHHMKTMSERDYLLAHWYAAGVQVVRHMKTMSKQMKQRESERAERATLVTQERLQLAKGPLPRSLRLPDLWIRPAFATKGRKVSGTLEAHVNGFKYSTNRVRGAPCLATPHCSAVLTLDERAALCSVFPALVCPALR